jgi:hypothetical protein
VKEKLLVKVQRDLKIVSNLIQMIKDRWINNLSLLNMDLEDLSMVVRVDYR